MQVLTNLLCPIDVVKRTVDKNTIAASAAVSALEKNQCLFNSKVKSNYLSSQRSFSFMH